MARGERSQREIQRGAADAPIQRHFDQVVAGVRDYAVFTLDVAGHVTSWNAGAEKIKGYKAEEIIGKHFSRFYPPEAIERNWPTEELKIAAGQGRFEEEGWRLRKDGAKFWADVVITALRSPGGKLTGFLKITRDLTERRRHEETLRASEERFRLLIDSVKEYAIFMLDPEGRVASWNSGAARIIGYTPAEIIGRPFRCFYPVEAAMHGAPQQDLQQAIEHGSLETNGLRVRKDGSRFSANVVIYAVRDLDGQLRGFSQVTRDLTERKQYEELAESHQRTYEFLAMLSHELRNPLAPLKTSVDLLHARDLADPVVERARDVIGRQVQHLTRIIDELVDVSRITSGRITLINETLDVESIIARAVETARPLLDSKGHLLVLKPVTEPVSILGDVTRLTQVLFNLLNNAAKYTPDGGRIEVEVEPIEERVAIYIRDNGVGMTSELLPQVFDLFTQGQRSLDRADGGLGVGLALVHRIVSLHGGAVKAYSEGPGRGSEFKVTLPRLCRRATLEKQGELRTSREGDHLGTHRDAERATPAHGGATRASRGRGREELPWIDAERATPAQGETSMRVARESQQPEPPHKRRRLMVIDDNKDAAESMSMLFELWGHEVICTYDGRAALEAAATYRPDAVFLDIGLPGMDGYEIAERLRELPEAGRTVLVAITGYGQDEDRRRSREAGIDHHLVKPVAPETLHRLLDSLDRRH
jgi:PAS domain S-box-containing protein